MTRQELLRIVIRQARANGFPFRRWFQSVIDPSWKTFEDAVDVLSQGKRYYALLFAHEFARAFWNGTRPMMSAKTTRRSSTR